MGTRVSDADWPPAHALVDAVREFLETDVMGATSGRTQYLARVAANVLAAVGRELGDPEAAGLAPAVAARFGADDEAGLCARIRDGSLDDRLPEVATALRDLARRRVQIANPRYLPDDDA